MEAYDYDLIVVGAGPGGYVAAISAAHKGLSVAVIEEREAGGTCLNRGCIPTKTYLHSAELYHQMKHSELFGIEVENFSVNFERLRARKEEVVSQLVTGIEALFKANKIQHIKGRAFVEDVSKVRVAEAIYTAKNILIATGAKPSMPPIKGLDLPDVMTSDEILDFKKVYKNLVVIGGGVIGVEMASIYNSFGHDVTIIEALPRILPFADSEISQNMSMILKKRGVKIFTNTLLDRIEQSTSLKCIFKTNDKEETIDADGVLISIGRVANTQNLFSKGLQEKLEIERHQIPVDNNYKTKVDGIYAIGDCTKGTIQLAHVAQAQGLNVINAINGSKQEINMSVVPSCIYTNPEIAYCGVTKEEAKDLGKSVLVGKYVMSGNGKTLIEAQERGFIKLVFEEASNVLIGAQLMCSRATDLIDELSLAIVNSLTAKQLLSTIRPHPTFVEAISEAIEDAYGGAIHVLPSKRAK